VVLKQRFNLADILGAVELSSTTPTIVSTFRHFVLREYFSMPGVGKAKLLVEQLGFEHFAFTIRAFKRTGLLTLYP